MENIENAQSSIIGTFPVCVDYQRSVEDSVLACKFTRSMHDPAANITSANFSTKRKKMALITIVILTFDRMMKEEQVIEEVKKMGYRFAEVRELLAFAEKYPRYQMDRSVTTLESNQNRRRFPYHPILTGNRGGDYTFSTRNIMLSQSFADSDVYYGEGYIFAVVKR
jgi:hypothetical protein